ncbi:MAG: UDP-N-acetylmuramoyl-L-alanyl-D-glutamate--2,6-diaminopimelate ligase [Negativicutes bacterium]|nr:UDP-N-acetylmuramoyl-L-alanyl-D-glutamate--2,6-diaminopimelate ligase [Negativicutes bacterium]
MRLQQLIQGLPYEAIGSTAIEISGLTSDSRKVRPGFLFMAEPGLTVDGHDYLQEAKASGAVAFLVERRCALELTQIIVPSTRSLLGILAARFYQQPADQLRMIGITGTKGKTTVAFLLEHFLRSAGKASGLLGSVQFRAGQTMEPSAYTTLPAVELQAHLARAVELGCTHMVMEVSSHALAQRRVGGVDFDTAIFTNFTHDHLDFHATMEQYLQAKTLLFGRLGNSESGRKGPKRAVINLDDPAASQVIASCAVPYYTFGLKAAAQVRAEAIELNPTETSFLLTWPQAAAVRVNLPLVGRFNVYNFLAAFTAGLAEGLPAAEMLAAVPDFAGVPGRFQQIRCGQTFPVIVDYAHTEDSLRQVLQTAREFTAGRLLLAFGCTGDRDRSKRPVMGKLAAELADFVVITSDDPHSENPEEIMQEIYAGIEPSCPTVELQPDRAKAIERLIVMAKTGDTVLIAGKGHEQVQIFKDYQLPFSDEIKARECLRRLGYLQGKEV